MNKYLSLIAVLQLAALLSLAQPIVEHLLTENRTNPIGLDIREPRFSWQLSTLAGGRETTDRNVRQTAYEINVSAQSNGKGILWNSGKISSGQSVHLPYGGPALQSGKRYTWRVR